MLRLLFLPIRIVGSVLHVVFSILGGVLSAVWGIIAGVFGLVGGIVSLGFKLLVTGLLVGLIVAVFRKRSHRNTYVAEDEPFHSFYNQRR